jgi:hypothetical protein
MAATGSSRQAAFLPALPLPKLETRPLPLPC